VKSQNFVQDAIGGLDLINKDKKLADEKKKKEMAMATSKDDSND
jgi:hypothetical protein